MSYHQANLGNEQRNEKFLRLMGGSGKKPSSIAPDSISTDTSALSSQDADQKLNEKQDEEEIKYEITTANNWESAQLGDNARKNKFLRLMGATRASESKSSISTGVAAKPERKGFDASQLERDLEQQYQQGIEFRRTGGARHHRGFGFVEAEFNPAATKTDPATPAVEPQVPAEQSSAGDIEANETARDLSRREQRIRSGEQRHYEPGYQDDRVYYHDNRRNVERDRSRHRDDRYEHGRNERSSRFDHHDRHHHGYDGHHRHRQYGERNQPQQDHQHEHYGGHRANCHKNQQSGGYQDRPTPREHTDASPAMAKYQKPMAFVKSSKS